MLLSSHLLSCGQQHEVVQTSTWRRLAGNWANSLHELLRRKLAATAPAKTKALASQEPLLSAPGPLREQFQLHQDSMQQAAQVHANFCDRRHAEAWHGFAFPYRGHTAAQHCSQVTLCPPAIHTRAAC